MRHSYPIDTSVWTTIALNFGNPHLGRGLPGSIVDPSIKIDTLQVATKTQDLLMVASATTFEMHILWSDPIDEENLPPGLVDGDFTVRHCQLLLVI